MHAAWQSGFTVILTRDVEFATSAAKAFQLFPKMSVVIITIPKKKQNFYVEEFEKALGKTPYRFLTDVFVVAFTCAGGGSCDGSVGPCHRCFYSWCLWHSLWHKLTLFI